MSIRANELSRVTTIDGNPDVILVDPSTNSGSIISAQALADSGTPHGYNDLKQKVAALSGGTPTAAKTVSEMTDKTRLYAYTGSEAGYTAGDWYYWNGTAWTSGGAYGDIALDDTLTVQGAAADAKAAGDAIGTASKSIMGLYPIETASGPIAVIHDGADSLPVRDLSVAIEPAQSFNGYDNPWAGGAGKNILPYPYTETTKTASGITYTVNNDGTVKVNGTATANVSLNLGNFTFQSGVAYVLNGCPSGGGNDKYNITVSGVGSDIGSGYSFTGDGTSKLVRIWVVQGQTVNNIVFKPMIRKSSVTDATYEPYSNICPISGWDAVKVARTGKNLLSNSVRSKSTFGVTFTVNPDRSITIATDGASTGRANLYYSGELHLPPSDYYLSIGNGNAFATKQCYFELQIHRVATNSNDYINTKGVSGRAFALNEGDYIKQIYFSVISGETVNGTIYPQIEIGSTATTYEPYPGEIYDITLPSTVYGGTLDVTKGILTVDRAMVDLGTLTWSKGNRNTADTGYVFHSQGIVSAISRDLTAKAICSAYVQKLPRYGSWEALAVGQFQVEPSGFVIFVADYADATAFKTAMDGVMLCYPLATPITYTLTPVQVKTLLGENRIYADAGQVTVEYRVDFNAAGLMFIPKAPTADGSYRLTADVTGGTPTYRWEAAE